MAVAPPPSVPSGVLQRVRADMRSQRAARGGWPPGETSFSPRRTREFEREPLPLLLRLRERHGPVFTIRLLYAPVVFALGPEANHHMTVSHASNFRWRDGGMGDLIPLLGDGLLTTDGEYHRRARRIMLPAFHREQLAASTSIMEEEAENAGSPWRAMNRARATLDRVIFAEIARRRASGERGVDILSLLLDASDEDGSRLSDRELRDQVMTLLFAGHDTATSTVAFMFYELARNPQEVDPLSQLDMVLDETLRMYPPAWIGPRRSIEPFELHGVRVPGGVMVNYCSWASHHLPEVFPEPWSFLPARFAPDAKAALPKGAYVPFGGGSRTCIGMRFGQLEIKAIARAILSRFRLELAEPERRLSIRQMPTLSPRGGLPVVVRARE